MKRFEPTIRHDPMTLGIDSVAECRVTDCGFGTGVILSGIDVVVPVVGEALESAGEQVRVTIEEICAKLIDDDENHEGRPVRAGTGKPRWIRRA